MRKASEGIQILIDDTAGPEVVSTVVVDQRYAAVQHEDLQYIHDQGGRAKFLEAPMFENHVRWIQEFANDLLDEGREAHRGWGGVGRQLKDAVKDNAPKTFGALQNSASLSVKVGGAEVISEPAAQPRLSDAELRAIDKTRPAWDKK